jgi:hypothetical protein
MTTRIDSLPRKWRLIVYALCHVGGFHGGCEEKLMPGRL